MAYEIIPKNNWVVCHPLQQISPGFWHVLATAHRENPKNSFSLQGTTSALQGLPPLQAHSASGKSHGCRLVVGCFFKNMDNWISFLYT